MFRIGSRNEELAKQLVELAVYLQRVGGDVEGMESGAAREAILEWHESLLAADLKTLKEYPDLEIALQVQERAKLMRVLGRDPVEAWEALTAWAQKTGRIPVGAETVTEL